MLPNPGSANPGVRVYVMGFIYRDQHPTVGISPETCSKIRDGDYRITSSPQTAAPVRWLLALDGNLYTSEEPTPNWSWYTESEVHLYPSVTVSASSNIEHQRSYTTLPATLLHDRCLWAFISPSAIRLYYQQPESFVTAPTR